MCLYPTIDLTATGQNIVRLRKERGLSVKQLQTFFGFDDPQAIYKWQWGKCLPSVDNLYALSVLLDVPMNEILVSSQPKLNLTAIEQQAKTCCSVLFYGPVLRDTAENEFCFHLFEWRRPSLYQANLARQHREHGAALSNCVMATASQRPKFSLSREKKGKRKMLFYEVAQFESRYD